MKHDTQKQGQPRYFVVQVAWRNFIRNNTLVPTDMQERMGSRWSYSSDWVSFYEYPDGFYGGIEGRQLWKLNRHHRDWAYRVRAAIKGECECPAVWD